MKSTEKLTELTLEQLTEKKKKLVSLSIGIAISMVIACGVLFYLAIKTKNYALMAVGMGSLITLLPVFVSVTEITKEIKRREKQA
jgi:Kef-type K+ transport system membrane component KefB